MGRRCLWVLPFAALFFVPLGCGRPDSSDSIAIYSAALSAPNMLRRGRGFVLDPYLMSDSGTFEASGRLSDDVVAFLRAQGLVQEVCSPPVKREEVPDCHPDSVGVELRVSRPVPLGDSAFAVFVAQGSVKARRDTFSVFIPFGTSHRCVVAQSGGHWSLRGCDLHMIT